MKASSVRWLIVLAALIALFVSNFATLPTGRAQGDPTPTPPGGKSLSEQAGFADALLNELQLRGLNTLGDSLEFEAYGRKYRLLAVWEMLTGSPIPLMGAVLLYDMTATPTLIWSFDYGRYNGQSPYLYQVGNFADQSGAIAPGRWLGDDRTFFAVASSHTGTAWSRYIVHVYELRADNTVISALKGQIPRGHIVTGVDNRYGEKPTLVLTDLRGEMAMETANCCGPRVQRYYEYQDGRWVDASAKYTFNYYTDIGYAVNRLTTEPIDSPNETAARLLELLMVYEAMGKRAEGWAFVNYTVAFLKAGRGLAEGTYIDTVFLPAMRAQFESGVPFTAPEFTGVDPNLFMDWYDEQPKTQ